MERRRFLKTSGLAPITSVALAGALSGCGTASTHSVGALSTESPSADSLSAGNNPFQHGVASGDPLTDRVILWSRVSPESATDQQPKIVRWWVALDQFGDTPVVSGTLQARQEHDYTVKVDATGLTPDQRYYYGFEHNGIRSPTGRTRTLPDGQPSGVRLAVTSCANYPQGYFNAYRHIANSTDLHAVLSLGDYFYEYGEGEYGVGAELDRIPEPPHEIVTLNDYRIRHAQHKADEDLQAAHAAHPWIVVWDDHESANNSWAGGAENHNPENGEGDWSMRKTAAVKAYYEWMPIRELPTGLFRHFRFGNLADLVMLDTRLRGRDKQVEAGDLAAAMEPERTLLGPIQEQLFLDHLSQTSQDDVCWKMVGQQIVFAPWSNDDTLLNPDSWDGYRASRQTVLDHLAAQAINNVIILTGDVHSAWGMEVPNKDRTSSQAIELVTPAVSSPPLASLSPRTQELVSRASQDQPHVKYADGLNNGYLVVDLTPDRARADWYFTGPSNQRTEQPVLDKTLESLPESNRLTEPG